MIGQTNGDNNLKVQIQNHIFFSDYSTFMVQNLHNHTIKLQKLLNKRRVIKSRSHEIGKTTISGLLDPEPEAHC